MCGIVGVVSRAPVDPSLVTRMRDTLGHRGPDAAGIWRSTDGRVCLGHRRLSIIDLDARANQPMCSPDGRFVLTFNGEIYNFRDVRRVLAGEGVTFHTESDSEVLIEALRRWGPSALDRLSGMFAFALWDARERRLYCARDRAGEKPFHYTVVGGAFLFASEIKALLAWPGVPRRIDHEAVVDFLSFGFVADPKTIWADVRKLAPAHALQVGVDPDGTPRPSRPERYWSLPFRSGTLASGDEIRSCLLHAADEMSISDVPLGAFLSGGVDSSSVTAALGLSGHDVRSFTIGFRDAAYDERPWAQVVADRYATSHVATEVEPLDVQTAFDTLRPALRRAFRGLLVLPDLLPVPRSPIGHQGSPVRRRGGRALRRLPQVPAPGAHGGALGRPAVEAGEVAGRRGGGRPPRRNRWRRTLRQYGLSPAQMLADMLCHGFPIPLLRKVARGDLARTLQHYDPYALVRGLLVDAAPEDVGLVNAMRHLDLALTLAGDILVKVDRASMAVSLEVRPLFLHRDVMELAARMPPEALATADSAKIALREAVRPWLPSDLLDRPKKGFALPLPTWLTGDSPMAERMRGALEEGPVADLLDLDRVRSVALPRGSRRTPLTGVIYVAFVLDQWFRTWASATGGASAP